MLFPILRHLRSTRSVRKIDPGVSRDADELVQLWGHAAYERAAELSWKEDRGLVSSDRPGHWWRVRREIGRRVGHHDAEPLAEFAA